MNWSAWALLECELWVHLCFIITVNNCKNSLHVLNELGQIWIWAAVWLVPGTGTCWKRFVVPSDAVLNYQMKIMLSLWWLSLQVVTHSNQNDHISSEVSRSPPGGPQQNLAEIVFRFSWSWINIHDFLKDVQLLLRWVIKSLCAVSYKWFALVSLLCFSNSASTKQPPWKLTDPLLPMTR